MCEFQLLSRNGSGRAAAGRMAVMVVALLVGGCEKEETQKVSFPAKSGTAPQATDNSTITKLETGKPSGLPPGHPDISSPPVSAPPPMTEAPKMTPSGKAGLATVKFRGFAVDVPESWSSTTPANPMRAAQFGWPKAAGDEDAPQAVVFSFGAGSGGGVQANLERWAAQFVEETPTPGKTEELKSDHAKVTLMDKSGTFKQQANMMSSEFTAKANWRMLAAVVEIEGGPLFVRATGPAASMAAQRDAFVAAMQSFRIDK